MPTDVPATRWSLEARPKLREEPSASARLRFLRMVETGSADAWDRWVGTAVAASILAATVGLSIACGSAYRRWTKENDPLEPLRIGLERARTSYRGKRESGSELARLINEVLSEIDRSRSA